MSTEEEKKALRAERNRRHREGRPIREEPQELRRARERRTNASDGKILGVLGMRDSRGGLPDVLWKPGEPSEDFTFERFLDRNERRRQEPRVQDTYSTVHTPRATYQYDPTDRLDIARVADAVHDDLDHLAVMDLREWLTRVEPGVPLYLDADS